MNERETNGRRPLEGKVAVVTGASRGIGQAIAQRFASAGAKVAVTARSLVTAERSPYVGSLSETVELIHRSGGVAVAIEVDLSDTTTNRGSILQKVTESLGDTVDILVNNAAAARKFELRYSSMDADTFRESLEVNVWAGWDLAVKAIPGMRAKGAGWILNISSRGASPKWGPPYQIHPLVAGQCLYGGSKAMLDRVTTGAAMELYEDGIAVNTLAPEGSVATENARAVAGVDPASSEPLETMAEAALLLCSGDPKELTGRVAYSLSLLAERNQPVWNLEGSALLAGWQPEDIDASRLFGGYLH
jgi:citronellol/citronellal dehydrogenase